MAVTSSSSQSLSTGVEFAIGTAIARRLVTIGSYWGYLQGLYFFILFGGQVGCFCRAYRVGDLRVWVEDIT